MSFICKQKVFRTDLELEAQLIVKCLHLIHVQVCTYNSDGKWKICLIAGIKPEVLEYRNEVIICKGITTIFRDGRH